MENDKLNELVLFEKSKSLHIKRIPQETRESFIKLSEEEFDGDWGFALKHCLEQMIEYQYMKNALFNGLLNQNQEKVEAKPEVKKIKFLSGKEIEKEVIKNE
jgi:hypothetical protein